MRIDGGGRVSGLRDVGDVRRPAGTGARFSLTNGDKAGEAMAGRAAAPLSGIESMLILQSVEDPLSKRRRAMRRARRLLDVLDDIKMALLDRLPSPAELSRLSSLVRDQREQVDDPALEAILAEIELRAAVEMAKFERRRG